MIFIIRGPSCSGKDTFVNQHFKDHCVLTRDQFRLALFDDVNEQNKSDLVTEYMQHTLELRLRFGTGYTVINSTNLRYADISGVLSLAKKFGRKVSVISIDPPSLEELIRRNEVRVAGAKRTNSSLEKHIMKYYSFMPRFVEVAEYDPDFTFTRINQSWEVVT